MTIESIRPFIDKLVIQKKVPIWLFISENIEALRSNLSLDELKDLIDKLSKVSNNSGLALISLLMWPNDEIPKEFNKIVEEINTNLSEF